MVRLTKTGREYVHNVFDAFLNSGDLPDDLSREIMGFDYGDKQWNCAVHYLTHVVTDKDIRAEDPELDEIMRTELRRMINDLGVL